MRAIPKLLSRPINHVPAEITDPANVRHEANFQAGSKLANPFGRGAQMLGRGNGDNDEIIAKSSLMKDFSLTAAEDRAASR